MAAEAGSGSYALSSSESMNKRRRPNADQSRVERASVVSKRSMRVDAAAEREAERKSALEAEEGEGGGYTCDTCALFFRSKHRYDKHDCSAAAAKRAAVAKRRSAQQGALAAKQLVRDQKLTIASEEVKEKEQMKYAIVELTGGAVDAGALTLSVGPVGEEDLSDVRGLGMGANPKHFEGRAGCGHVEVGNGMLVVTKVDLGRKELAIQVLAGYTVYGAQSTGAATSSRKEAMDKEFGALEMDDDGRLKRMSQTAIFNWLKRQYTLGKGRRTRGSREYCGTRR
mmetsp:Transcript_42060/g.112124  ORF Transcript_42060/g.112124 Transcript_42060/m.112124 type:complete len:283 (-) Transcript_42060:32-880(-)